MQKVIRGLAAAALFITWAGCSSPGKEPAGPDLKKDAADSIAALKKVFPTNTGWEILPGDSANSFILASKDSVWVCGLMNGKDLGEDSVKLKYKTVYVLKELLSEADSISMRRLQDSVTKVSLDLVNQSMNAADQKEKDRLDAEEQKLFGISPVMPELRMKEFSVYIYRPDYNICSREKLDTEYELLQEAIKNYFLTGKFSFDELLKMRMEEEMRMKQLN